MKKLVSALLFCVMTPLLTAQEEGVLRSYDLRSMLSAYEDQGWQQALTVSPVSPSTTVRSTALSRADDTSVAGVVVELLTQLLGDELREEGREILLDGDDHLMVLAPPAVQARIRLVLEGLQEALRAEVQVRVEVYSVSGGEGVEPPATNVLDEAAAARLGSSLAARGATVASHVLRLRPGATAIADAERRIPFVMDYDVEIAQASQIFDPVVIEAQEGLRVVLRGTPVLGGVRLSAVVRGATLQDGVTDEQQDLRGYVAGEKEGITFLQGPMTIQSVDIGLHSIAFDSFLPDGKTLVVTTESRLGGKHESTVVLLRRVGSRGSAVTVVPDGNRQRKIVVVNSEVLRPPSLRVVQDSWGTVYDLEHPLVGVALQTDPSLFLFNWVKKRYAVWRRIGPWILIVTDPSWDRGVEELEALLQNFGGDTETMSLSLDVRTEGPEHVGFSAPLLVGSQCAVMVGRTSTALIDHDVEVAQFSAVVDPKNHPVYQGLALGLSSSRGRGSSLALELDGIARIQEGEMRLLDLAGSVLGAVELPRYLDMHLDDRVSFADDAGRPARIRLGEGTDISVELELR